MRKKINKAIALLAVLGILAGSGNVVYGNEENIADQEEQLTKEKESIYFCIIKIRIQRQNIKKNPLSLN